MIEWDLLGKRRDAFATITEMLPEGCRIVETGTIRELGNWAGDGQSTIVWDTIATERGGSVITIDINPIGAQLIATLNLTSTQAIVGDSLDVIPTLTGSVDLLYLDSFDVNFESPEPAAAHHLNELVAALDLLKPGSIVAVDDNIDGVGKGGDVARYLEDHQVPEIVSGYVRAWRIPWPSPTATARCLS